MGAWGTAIFADDTACDVRDEWRDAVLDGLQVNRSLEIIDADGDVSRWEEDGDATSAKQRGRVLMRLGEKLRGPQPRPKRLRRPIALSVPLEVGDVVRVRDRDDESKEALVASAVHEAQLMARWYATTEGRAALRRRQQ